MDFEGSSSVMDLTHVSDEHWWDASKDVYERAEFASPEKGEGIGRSIRVQFSVLSLRISNLAIALSRPLGTHLCSVSFRNSSVGFRMTVRPSAIMLTDHVHVVCLVGKWSLSH